MAHRQLTPYSGRRPLAERIAGFTPFMDLQREVNRLFDDMFGGPYRASEMRGREQGVWMTPRIDMTESDQELRVCAEVPGVAQEDVEVIVEDDMLMIRGEKKASSEQDRDNLHVSERSFGQFRRVVQLPFTPEPDKVRAHFDKGVLTVTMQRQDRGSERARHIDIEAGPAPESKRRKESGMHH